MGAYHLKTNKLTKNPLHLVLRYPLGNNGDGANIC